MRIFLSYPAEERLLAEQVSNVLRAERHELFLADESIAPGQMFDARIEDEINQCELFVFFITPEAVKEGSYPLTELKLAQRRWAVPTNHVLPVCVRSVQLSEVPAYLHGLSVQMLHGNPVAEIASAVRSRSAVRRPARASLLALGMGLLWGFAGVQVAFAVLGLSSRVVGFPRSALAWLAVGGSCVAFVTGINVASRRAPVWSMLHTILVWAVLIIPVLFVAATAAEIVTGRVDNETMIAAAFIDCVLPGVALAVIEIRRRYGVATSAWR